MTRYSRLRLLALFVVVANAFGVGARAVYLMATGETGPGAALFVVSACSSSIGLVLLHGTKR